MGFYVCVSHIHYNMELGKYDDFKSFYILIIMVAILKRGSQGIKITN